MILFVDSVSGYSFHIPQDAELGTDLSNCFVEIELQVLRKDGNKLTLYKDQTRGGDYEKIQPANDFFNTLFSDIEVLINGAVVGSFGGCFHPQMALLHNLLEYDELFQQAILTNSNVFIKDQKYPANPPAIRYQFIDGSKRLKLFGRLNHNVFTTKRLLLPNVSVQIRMKRSSSAYCLIRTIGMPDEYKVVVHNCALHARRVLFKESILEKLKKYSTNNIARFPYTKTSVIMYDIPQGMVTWRTPLQSAGPLARRAFFAISEPASINGNNWENNPMIFPASHYEVNHIQFYSDHEDQLLHKPFKPDFANENANRSYAALVQAATDGFRTGCAPGLSCNDFVRQYGLFAVDDLQNYGAVNVEVGFKKETPKPLIGLLFFQGEDYFSIDNNGVRNR